MIKLKKNDDETSYLGTLKLYFHKKARKTKLLSLAHSVWLANAKNFCGQKSCYFRSIKSSKLCVFIIFSPCHPRRREILSYLHDLKTRSLF